MAREVLSNGVIIPEKYTRDWFDDFRTNLVKLNDAITAIAGKQNALTQEQLDAVNSAITSQKVTAYDDHIADTSKHLTDGTASKAISDEDGTSIKTGYVNVAGSQTVTGDKSWTGSNTFNSILPNATNTYSLGSSSYQWSSVYAQTYYYNGTAWGLDKANVWTGDNTFTPPQITLKHSSVTRGTIPNANRNYILGFTDSNNDNVGMIFQQVRTGLGSYKMTFSLNNGTTDHRFNFFGFTDGTSSLIPEVSGVTELGSSSYKWKTLNGINPGALSLPDYNSTAKVDISGSIIPDVYNNIQYTPAINGWLYVCFDLSSATTNGSIFYIQAKDSNVANASFVQTSWMPTSGGISSIAIFFPVIANKQFIMHINFSNYSIIKAHVIPCLGNV